MPTERQPDLFDAAGSAAAPVPAPAERPRLVATALDDAALIAAIPAASRAECHALTGEAVRRSLGAAVPALEALCRRFRGFGRGHAVQEQVAALQALAALGGDEAAAAVARIVAGDVVQGPGLVAAMQTAATLRCRLPAERCLSLLRHPDPGIRAAAAQLAQPRAVVADPTSAALVDLLDDLNSAVARAAAGTLGRSGRAEARPLLLRMLGDDPSAAVIDAAAAVADERVVVMLGRIGRSRPDLTAAVIAALDDIDEPRAAALAAGLREPPSGE